MPIHKVLFWSGFGIAVRFWQLGIEMRPFFHKSTLWVYPVYATVGGSFGYWLMGVEQRQISFLTERRESLLERRKRVAEREGGGAGPALATAAAGPGGGGAALAGGDGEGQ